MDTPVRDPLKILCLTDASRATFEPPDARPLARVLRLVRAHPPCEPLPRVSGLGRGAALDPEAWIPAECRRHAGGELGLS